MYSLRSAKGQTIDKKQTKEEFCWIKFWFVYDSLSLSCSYPSWALQWEMRSGSLGFTRPTNIRQSRSFFSLTFIYNWMCLEHYKHSRVPIIWADWDWLYLKLGLHRKIIDNTKDVKMTFTSMVISKLNAAISWKWFKKICTTQAKLL